VIDQRLAVPLPRFVAVVGDGGSVPAFLG